MLFQRPVGMQMAKVDELSFSCGQRGDETWRELERVVGRLNEIDEEQQHLEALMLHLQRRRDQLDRQFAELLPVRDQLEAQAWDQAVERMAAEEKARLRGPRPPSISISAAADVTPEPMAVDPDSWDFAEAPEAVPVWVSPVKTWPLPIPGLASPRSKDTFRPRRGRSAAVAGPARRRATATTAAGR